MIVVVDSVLWGDPKIILVTLSRNLFASPWSENPPGETLCFGVPCFPVSPSVPYTLVLNSVCVG